MSNVQEALNKWGAKKYPDHAGKNFMVEAEAYNEGYCETCSYTTVRMVVYADFKEVGTTSIDLATIMREVFEANNE